MNECRHLLQQRDDDGTVWCLVCGGDIVDDRPIRSVPGQLKNVADDPFLGTIVGDTP